MVRELRYIRFVRLKIPLLVHCSLSMIVRRSSLEDRHPPLDRYNHSLLVERVRLVALRPLQQAPAVTTTGSHGLAFYDRVPPTKEASRMPGLPHKCPRS